MNGSNDAMNHLLPFGKTRTSDETGLSPEVQRTGLKIYRKAWDAYKEAGCPYGETDEAMLVWYSFQGETPPTMPSMGKN